MTIDKIQECALRPGTFFVFAVKPGTQQIHTEDIRICPPSGETGYISKEMAEGPTVSAEQSKNYYFKISSAPFPKAKVELVGDEALAQAEIRRCGLIYIVEVSRAVGLCEAGPVGVAGAPSGQRRYPRYARARCRTSGACRRT
jgi:hypothetical protein